MGLPQRHSVAPGAVRNDLGQHRDGGLLDRVGRFTEKVAKVVKNAEEAAGPVIPVLKTIGKLLPLALLL